MKEYEVTIHENLELKVTVKAVSAAEAENIVRDRWKCSDYILDSDCFTDVQFTARKMPSRSRER